MAIGEQGEVIFRHAGRLPQGLTAVETWWWEAPGGDEPEIWCYTDRMSYDQGEPVTFYTHTTAPTWEIEIYRDGAVRQVVHSNSGLPGVTQETSEDSYATGCQWEPSLEVDTADWQPGGYVAVVTATMNGRSERHEHWLALRPNLQPEDRAGRILLIAATSTWIAYNGWGGANHYEGLAGLKANSYSPTLSTRRPWSRGTAWLPKGAPRIPNEDGLPIGWVPRYITKEWALAAGYPKYYAAAGWAMYESLFVRWAESSGYTVDVVTQHDLHFRPESLDGYTCVVIVGHDEYWTWEMRDHLDRFIERGGNVARFAGNFLWQVRFEDDGERQVAYKYSASAADPVRDDPERVHLITSAWDDERIGRPPALTMGVSGARGVYAKTFGANARGSGGYTIYRPNHWVFAGTDLYYGDLLGADARVFGYEVDGLDYTIRDGLPYPTGADGIGESDVEILAMGLATSREEDHGNEGAVLYLGDGDAEFVAEVLYGEVTADTVERVGRGCGTMVTYQKGEGVVFNTGTVEWVNGLRSGDEFIDRITKNVLGRFLGKPVPA